jgi:hypothetical protein
MVFSVILNCPSQALCMSFTKAFTASEPRQTSDGRERPDDGKTVPENPGKDTVHPGQWLSSEADVGK